MLLLLLLLLFLYHFTVNLLKIVYIQLSFVAIAAAVCRWNKTVLKDIKIKRGKSVVK